MPKVINIFDYCPNLESISISEIAEYSGPHASLIPIENKLGNRILYPNTVPTSIEDLDFDLSVLKTILEANSQYFYKKNTHKILIPEELSVLLPDIPKLIKVFIDALNPLDFVTLVLQSSSTITKSLGTLIRPNITQKSGLANLEINGKQYHSVALGSLLIFPVTGSKVDIKFESKSALLLGRDRVIAEVAGGSLGIILDLRKNQ